MESKYNSKQLVDLLYKYDNNKTKVAEELNMDRANLNRYLRKAQKDGLLDASYNVIDHSEALNSIYKVAVERYGIKRVYKEDGCVVVMELDDCEVNMTKEEIIERHSYEGVITDEYLGSLDYSVSIYFDRIDVDRYIEMLNFHDAWVVWYKITDGLIKSKEQAYELYMNAMYSLNVTEHELKEFYNRAEQYFREYEDFKNQEPILL